jgi:myosin protein heavy chain
MQSSQLNGSPRRANPFSRQSPSPSPGPQVVPSRPKSVAFPSPSSGAEKKSHARNSSLSHFSSVSLTASGNRERSSSLKQNVEASGTFAPQFINSEELRRGADDIKGREGDNDFSGKRYVWLKDSEKAFIRALVVEERDNGELVVQCDDGGVCTPIRNFDGLRLMPIFLFPAP